MAGADQIRLTLKAYDVMSMDRLIPILGSKKILIPDVSANIISRLYSINYMWLLNTCKKYMSEGRIPYI